MTDKTLDVVAIGNAIVDVLSRADEAFLASHGMVKGSMQLIDSETAERIYDAMGPGTEASGGSAANTAAGLASFGSRWPSSARSATTSWARSSPTTCSRSASTTTSRRPPTGRPRPGA